MSIQLIPPNSWAGDKFWEESESWPHDPPGYIFLARALDIVGLAKYGERWTDLTSKIAIPEDPPDDCHDEAVWEQSELDDEKYVQEMDAAEAELERRWAEVAREIAVACEAGTIITAARNRLGGEMIELNMGYWNTEYFMQRFIHCDLSLDQPFVERPEKGSRHEPPKRRRIGYLFSNPALTNLWPLRGASLANPLPSYTRHKAKSGKRRLIRTAQSNRPFAKQSKAFARQADSRLDQDQ
jgi:hypothetical protein